MKTQDKYQHGDEWMLRDEAMDARMRANNHHFAEPKKARVKRPRITTREHINVLHDDATIYVLDITHRKPHISAEVMASLRDNKRIAAKLGHSNAVCDLFPMSKLSRMIIKAINKGKTFTYRDELPEGLSGEYAYLNVAPAEISPVKTANIDAQFRKRQKQSAKQLAKAIKQTAQSNDQADVLQVA